MNVDYSLKIFGIKVKEKDKVVYLSMIVGHGGERSLAGCLKVKVTQSCLTLCNPWPIQSMAFSRPEYWSG